MNKWEVIHESDDENGNATCWSKEINHNQYGKYVWLTENDNGYDVEVDYDGFVTLKTCKSLSSAKRWVKINLEG